MAERSKALRSGRSPLLWAWVQIPLLTKKEFFSLAYSRHYLVRWWDAVLCDAGLCAARNV